MSVFEGAGVALVTPFTEDGVNFDTLKKMIDFQIDGGIDSIVLCGTTGEPATMTLEEKKAVIIEGIKYINKRVPAIGGTGANGTQSAIEMSKFAQEAGADALLLVTPYYNKCSQQGLIAHYNKIMDAVDIPCILYNVPSRTGVNIKPETLAVIAEHKNCAGIKEASGNISQVAEMARLCKGKLEIYSGNDDQVVPLMSLGGKGVISVIANIAPQISHDITHAYLDGDTKKACELQLKYNPLANAMFMDVNPIPIKMALNMIGFDAGPLRLPLSEMDEQKTAKLEGILRDFDLIK